MPTDKEFEEILKPIVDIYEKYRCVAHTAKFSREITIEQSGIWQAVRDTIIKSQEIRNKKQGRTKKKKGLIE